MNQRSYDNLSQQNKAVIDKLGGPGAFEIMKDAWDELTIETHALVKVVFYQDLETLDKKNSLSAETKYSVIEKCYRIVIEFF